MSQKPSSEEGRTDDNQAAMSLLVVDKQAQKSQGAEPEDEALILHNAPKSDEIALDREQAHGDGAQVCRARAAAEEKDCKQSHEIDPGKRQTHHPLIGSSGQTPDAHDQRDFGRSLLMLEQDSVITLQSTGRTHHYDGLIPLKL